MPQRDTIDFAAAFAVGAVLGIGAALLLRPPPPTRTERILKDLEPYRRKMKKRVQEARRGFGEGTGATRELGGLLREAGREVLRDFQDEVREVLSAAREEFGRSVSDQLDRAEAKLRDGARHVRKA